MKKIKPSKEEGRGQIAFNLFNSIAEYEKQRRGRLLMNARDLLEMYEEKLYKDYLGNPDASWNEFLADTQVYYSANKVYNMRRVYKMFVQNLNKTIEDLREIPFERLVTLLPIVPFLNENDTEEWLKKAQLLSPDDFKNEIRQLKGLPTTDECKHDLRLWSICRVCGFKHQTGDFKDITDESKK